MKYYSEDDVMDLIREAEDCERAYEWGNGHKRIHFEDYNPIEIPDKHGELIDRMSAIHRFEAEFDSDIAQDIIGLLLAEPTVVEATE